jgi:hypothetical protein
MDGEKVAVKFIIKLPQQFAVSQTQILVPVNHLFTEISSLCALLTNQERLSRYGLFEVINHLLGLGSHFSSHDCDYALAEPHVPFDFLLFGEFNGTRF